jgi:hypothetical protein
MLIERCEGVFGVFLVGRHFPNFSVKNAVRGTERTLTRSPRSKSLYGQMRTTNVQVSGLDLNPG